jgi:hypothetical protein
MEHTRVFMKDRYSFSTNQITIFVTSRIYTPLPLSHAFKTHSGSPRIISQYIHVYMQVTTKAKLTKLLISRQMWWLDAE